MALKLNLLPSEYGKLGTTGKILRSLRALGVISFALFFVFALGTSAFFIISTITLNGLKNDIDSLKSQVTAEQTSEQQIVLLKDRVGKIKTILAAPDATKNLSLISPYISSLSASSKVSDISIDPSKVNLALNFVNNTDLSNFLSAISKDSQFGSVRMTSFTFNDATGYSLEILAVNK